MTNYEQTLEKLYNHGIKRIITADDAMENQIASLQCMGAYDKIDSLAFNNGKDVVELIEKEHDTIDLILTDLQMETKTAGLDVIEAAYSHHIPAAIVTAGKHRDDSIVKMVPDPYTIKGNKDDPETWHKMLERVESQLSEKKGLLYTVGLARKAGILESMNDGYDDFSGEQARKVCEGFLSINM